MTIARPFLGASLLVIVSAASGCLAPTPEVGDDEPGALMFSVHDVLGPILTDSEGRTLYMFTNDEPTVSNCYDQCAANWPPLTAESVPEAPSEISGHVTLTTRNDGSRQVVYRETPLYYFAGDDMSGQANGDGLNGVWFVVREPPTNAEMLNGKGEHEVVTDEPTYFDDSTGFYAAPTTSMPEVGVVMVHEWWGLNDNIRDMARLLASHGYAVLAVDLFNGSVATTSQEAQAQVGSLDQDEANANMRAAADHLREQGIQRVASLGWCFGGGQSLQLALSGEVLVATVIYYGFLVDDESRLGAIDWPVLGIFGEDDSAIPPGNVRAFERALDNLSIQNEIYIYPDVGHAFANPSGDAWAPEQTQDAWARTLAFLEANTA